VYVSEVGRICAGIYDGWIVKVMAKCFEKNESVMEGGR